MKLVIRLVFFFLPFCLWAQVEDLQQQARQKWSLGQEKQAFFLAHKALQATKDQPNAAHYNSLLLLFELHFELGHIEQARQYGALALQLNEQAGFRLGSSQFLYKQLARLEQLAGQYEAAELFLMQAQEQLPPLLGPPSFDRLELLAQLAEIYQLKGQEFAAQQIYDKILQQKNIPKIDRLKWLYGAALLAQTSSNWPKAEALFQEALALTGPTEAYQREVLNAALAKNAWKMGKAALAQKRYTQLYQQRQKKLGQDHPLTLALAGEMAYFYESQGELAQSEALMQLHIQSLIQEIDELAQYLSYQEFLRVQQSLSPQIHRFIAWVARQPQQKWLKLLAQLQLAVQARGQEEASAFKQALSALKESHFMDLKMDWEESSQLLAQSYRLGKDKAALRFEQAELKAKLKTLEKELKAALRQKEIPFQPANAELSQLQAQLDSTEAAINIFHYQDHNGQDWQKESNLAALIFTQDSLLLWQPLGTEAAISPVLSHIFRLQSTADINRSYLSIPALSELLDQQLWQPLRPHLGDKKRLHLQLPAILQVLSFEAIMQSHNKHYLIEDYEINYYSSFQKLKQGQDYADKAAFLMGGVDFGQKPKRSPWLAWDPLPGSLSEVENLEVLLYNSAWESELYTSGAANEVRFLEMLKERPFRLIHLATHAYFFEPNTTETTGISFEESPNRLSLKEQLAQEEEQPLMRSGLVFAGANLSWQGPASSSMAEADGILTALDLLSLELKGCELLVLSACQTALGQRSAQEGLLGLPTAFRQAGVDYFMGSRWSINDKATAIFMGLFYDYYLAGEPPQTAFRKAQLTLMKEEKGRYAHPYYWAAFQLLR